MQTASLTQGFLFTHGKKGFLNSGRMLTGAEPPAPAPPGRPHGVGVECEGYRRDVLTEVQDPLPEYTAGGQGAGGGEAP